jgi:hypothetical protein
VSAGGEHSCALLVDGSIRCWGRNTSGELGDGTLFDSPSPVVVPGIADAWTVRAGRGVTCAGMSKTLPWEVSVRCWGRAVYGALGNDYRPGDPVNEPNPIPLQENFSPILFALTVEKHGDGTGRVTSLHPGIDCGSDCSEALPPGSIVRLSATADPPASFYRWAGDADCSDGVVQLEADRHCVALIPEPGSGVALAAGLVLLIRLRRPFAGRGSRPVAAGRTLQALAENAPPRPARDFPRNV